MKILHIISQSPDFTGSGKFIREIIRQASLNSHENYLVAGTQSDFEMSQALIPRDRCRFVRFDGRDLHGPLPGMSDVMPYESRVFSKMSTEELDAYQTEFSNAIEQAVEHFKPDILHTHHLWIVSMLARKVSPGLPMVTTCHGTCLRQHYLCPHIGPGLIKDLKQINRVMALSRDQEKKIVRTVGVDPEKIRVVSGGYNQQSFFYEPKVYHGIVELVYAGKLSFAKGVPWLLKSLKKLKDLPFRLHMAGSGAGPEKEACLALAKELGNKVVYHGPLSHERLGRLMRNSHIFVLPSFYEGLPLVLMEALASGCRLITTDLAGVKEILGAEESPMVKMVPLPVLETIDTPYEKDLPELENCLAAFLKQGIEDVQKKAVPDMNFIRSATLPFTWEKVFSKIENVYREVMP